MTLKNALRVSLTAACFLVLESFIYSATGMHRALATATLASVIAYKFQWLMAFTLAAGIFAPLAAFIESQTRRRNVGFLSWAVFVGLAMVGYTAVSFLSVPSGSVAPPFANALSNKPKISQAIQFVDSKVELLDPETIKMDIGFKNLTQDEFTELDYTFAAVEGGRIFYRIKMRDAVYLPPDQIATTSLTWRRSSFKDPRLFDQLHEAYTKKTLRIFAKPSRAVRINGKTIEE